MINDTRIKILNDIVANQIAAGEVVERPVSVVKELVENALDAGAKDIKVVLSDGGRSLIQIIDDGAGMGVEDAELSVERFATSKISTSNELERISTFGFRGEALPSIASVSRFSLHTSNGVAGTEVVISGGKRERTTALPRSTGTTISVRDLFFNTPARRSFLRSEKSELALIRSLLFDFAVSNPLVRFSLISEGSENLVLPAFPGTEDFIGFKNRVRELKLAGSDPLECSGELETAAGLYRCFAVLTKPLDCVSGAGKLRLLVNGRSVRDKILLRAIRDAYGNFLRSDKFPAGVIQLFVPPMDLDVNVHPQKTEVRYRFPERIFAVVRQAVGVSLRREVPQSAGGELFFSDEPSLPGHSSGVTGNLFDSLGVRESLPEFQAKVDAKEQSLTTYRFVGQIFKCYLLLEHPAGLFAIVDMHAAHERVVFAKLKRDWSEGDTVSQSLLIPETIQLPAHLKGESSEILSLLESIGFEIEMLGEESLVIRGMPALLARVGASALISDLFSEISVTDIEGALERRVDAVLSRIACHGSVRTGKEMEAEECYQLLRDLESSELRAFCPHGRSVSRVMGRAELEQLFGRIQ